ncbi:MAG: hypothetical protein RIS45_477 [Planctomycetota bacterium]|jgi:hypothetical protein
MTLRWLLVLAMALGGCVPFAVGGLEEEPAHMGVRCSITANGDGSCVFTNQKPFPASACAVYSFTNRSNRQTIETAPICSGRVEAMSTTQPVPISMAGASLATHCVDPQTGFADIRTEAICTSEIRVTGETNLSLPVKKLVAYGFYFLVVVPSSFTMWLMARRRNMDTPRQYLIGGLFLWIVALPLFLYRWSKPKPVAAPPVAPPQAPPPPQW